MEILCSGSSSTMWTKTFFTFLLLGFLSFFPFLSFSFLFFSFVRVKVLFLMISGSDSSIDSVKICFAELEDEAALAMAGADLV